MSASREKKQRRSDPEQGLTQKQRAELREQKAAKQKTVLYTAIGVIIAILVVILLVWHSGIFQRGATALTVDGRRGCACVERWEDTAAVKELLLPPELEKRGLAALAEQMGAARWTVRVPDPAGTPFGMLRWYRQDIARRWDWIHAAGHLGLAFD